MEDFSRRFQWRGQNDARIGEFTITDSQFKQYIERNRSVERHGIRVLPESNELMTGGYVMVDPLGTLLRQHQGPSHL